MPGSAAADEPPASKKKRLTAMRSNAQQPPPARRQPQSVPQEQHLAEAREARQSRVEAKPRRSRGAEKPRSRTRKAVAVHRRAANSYVRLSDVRATRVRLCMLRV